MEKIVTLGLDESFEEMRENLRHLDFIVALHYAVRDRPPHSLAADVTRRAGGQIGESLQYSEADKCWWFVINHPQIHDSVLKMWPEILDVKRAS